MLAFYGIECYDLAMSANPETTAINVSLPSPLRAWVEQVVSTGGYGSVSEYVRELIRADQKRRANEKLEALLIEGLESGKPMPATAEFWSKLREDAHRRLGGKTA